MSMGLLALLDTIGPKAPRNKKTRATSQFAIEQLRRVTERPTRPQRSPRLDTPRRGGIVFAPIQRPHIPGLCSPQRCR